MSTQDAEKQAAAEAAAALVEDGMTVGLGTGSTVAFLLAALARRRLRLRCVATSPATALLAGELGLTVEDFSGTAALDRLDIAIDGADQVTRDGWLIKGGGAAHLREKLVEVAADRFVVIASSDKLVERLTAPVPVELMAFGLAATLRRLGAVTLRNGPPSPDDNVIGDWYGDLADPAAAAATLDVDPGVAGHGLFPPVLVHDVLLGTADGVVCVR